MGDGLVPVGGVFLKGGENMKESLRAKKCHLIIAAELLQGLEVVGKRLPCLAVLSAQKIERTDGPSSDEALRLFGDQLFCTIKLALQEELVEKQSLKRESFIVVEVR